MLVAVALGAAVGFVSPALAVRFEPLGLIFIKLVKMVIAPLVFATVVVGIAGMGDMRKVGRVGVKALIWFEGMTTLALVIGLVVVNLVKPGSGVTPPPSTVGTADLAKVADPSKARGFVDFVMGAVPETFVGAFSSGDMLQVLVIAVLCGFSLARLGERGHLLLELTERGSEALFDIVALIMRLAPLGAFGAMAFTVGRYGVESLASMVWLMLCVYATCLLFVLVVLGLAMRALGLSIVAFIAYIRHELLVVLGTSSSEAALPNLMARLEELGCPRSVVGLVVPTGYSFNLDGTSIYLTMAAVFLAQATNTPLPLRPLWRQRSE